MPRGVRKSVEYTGKALKAWEKVQRLQDELHSARQELKDAYKEQLKDEKAAEGKRQKEEQQILLKAIRNSGKTVDELLAAING